MSQKLENNRQPVVLVIDDNPAIRDMVSWALELDGYISAEASEGQEALNWLSNAAREGYYPSVILLDLAMPGMDGGTFLEHFQEEWAARYPQASVVVITASTRAREAEKLNVRKVIIKPFHVRDLLDVVRQLAV